MINHLEYRDHPGTPMEEHKILEIGEAGGDYYFRITDMRKGKSLYFRYCISGGFEKTHPELTKAISELHRLLHNPGINRMPGESSK